MADWETERDKAAAAKATGMRTIADPDDRHPCPKDGCDKLVPFEVLACKTHWFELPTEVRRTIARLWRKQDLSAWAGQRKFAVALLNGLDEQGDRVRYIETPGAEQLALDDPYAVETFRPKDAPPETPAGGWQDG